MTKLDWNIFCKKGNLGNGKHGRLVFWGNLFVFFFYCDYFLVFSCSLSVVTVNTPALSLGWTHSVTDTCWLSVERNAKKIEYYSIFSALRECRATATEIAFVIVIKLKTPEIVKLKKV